MSTGKSEWGVALSFYTAMRNEIVLVFGTMKEELYTQTIILSNLGSKHFWNPVKDFFKSHVRFPL